MTVVKVTKPISRMRFDSMINYRCAGQVTGVRTLTCDRREFGRMGVVKSKELVYSNKLLTGFSGG